jgi:hypothetical protein
MVGYELKVPVFPPKVQKGVQNTLNRSLFDRLNGCIKQAEQMSS